MPIGRTGKYFADALLRHLGARRGGLLTKTVPEGTPENEVLKPGPGGFVHLSEFPTAEHLGSPKDPKTTYFYRPRHTHNLEPHVPFDLSNPFSPPDALAKVLAERDAKVWRLPGEEADPIINQMSDAVKRLGDELLRFEDVSGPQWDTGMAHRLDSFLEEGQPRTSPASAYEEGTMAGPLREAIKEGRETARKTDVEIREILLKDVLSSTDEELGWLNPQQMKAFQEYKKLAEEASKALDESLEKHNIWALNYYTPSQRHEKVGPWGIRSTAITDPDFLETANIPPLTLKHMLQYGTPQNLRDYGLVRRQPSDLGEKIQLGPHAYRDLDVSKGLATGEQKPGILTSKNYFDYERTKPFTRFDHRDDVPNFLYDLDAKHRNINLSTFYDRDQALYGVPKIEKKAEYNKRTGKDWRGGVGANPYRNLRYRKPGPTEWESPEAKEAYVANVIKNYQENRMPGTFDESPKAGLTESQIDERIKKIFPDKKPPEEEYLELRRRAMKGDMAAYREQLRLGHHLGRDKIGELFGSKERGATPIQEVFPPALATAFNERLKIEMQKHGIDPEGVEALKHYFTRGLGSTQKGYPQGKIVSSKTSIPKVEHKPIPGTEAARIKELREQAHAFLYQKDSEGKATKFNKNLAQETYDKINKKNSEDWTDLDVVLLQEIYEQLYLQ